MALYLPEVTVKYIDWLIEQAQNEYPNYKWIRDLQRAVQQQQNELQIFVLIVDNLQKQYKEKQQSYDQLLHRLKQELSEQVTSIHKEEQMNKHDEELLDFLEQQLHYWRSHATQHRDKKAKREHQYIQTYFFPVVNAHYQKKYIQARDKTNQVEQQLSDLHHAMDFVKTRLKQHQYAIAARLDYCHTLEERQQQLHLDMDKLQELMTDMKQAQSFWCQFNTKHILPYLDLLDEDREYDGDINNSTSSFNDNRWTNIRQSTLAYEKAQSYGLLYYSHHRSTWDIGFLCTQCHKHINCWPCLDKKTPRLLCLPCYQHILLQTSKRKELAPVISNLKYQPGEQSSSSSIFSTSKTIPKPSLFHSTMKSTHLLLNECRPFVKKVKSTLILNRKLDVLIHQPILVSRYLYRSILS